MGGGFHGGFGNTKGSITQSSTWYKEPKNGCKARVRHYVATKSLINHIENPDISGSLKKGIKGGHKEDNFLSSLTKLGAKIVRVVDYPEFNGIKVIYYQLPEKDKTGKPTSEFRKNIMKKTVYDHNKLPTSTYIARGLGAANNATTNSGSGKLPREWRGVDSKGITWRGYCSPTGNLISFFPE
ncbi:MAG: EndoU domain-containing protein [Succinivibrionaceae bacterium]|nr:EndoU domain-containing protein [Succinivibrionaceae bacterium]